MSKRSQFKIVPTRLVGYKGFEFTLSRADEPCSRRTSRRRRKRRGVVLWLFIKNVLDDMKKRIDPRPATFLLQGGSGLSLLTGDTRREKKEEKRRRRSYTAVGRPPPWLYKYK
jgi:hypothetical protein